MPFWTFAQDWAGAELLILRLVAQPASRTTALQSYNRARYMVVSMHTPVLVVATHFMNEVEARIDRDYDVLPHIGARPDQVVLDDCYPINPQIRLQSR
jgi:hypothetical protein